MTSKSFYHTFLWFGISMFLMLGSTDSLRAQSSGNSNNKSAKPRLSKFQLNRQRVNSGTVGIISGEISGTYIHIATDLATVLDKDVPPRLRILPIAGKGGVRNIEDLIYMSGVELAIVQSDVMEFINNKKLLSYSPSRLQYITKLYDSELHILANKNIKSIQELNGKTVNLWNKDSSTDITGQNLFKALNIKPKIVYLDNKLGIQKTMNGEIAATFLIVGKPVKYFQKLPTSTGLHFLPVEYKGSLQENYLPSRLTPKDYPNLISKDKAVSTLSTSTLLVTYRVPRDGWRYRKVTRFVNEFFTNIQKFQKPPRHPKWKEANLLAKIPGWKRFTYAQQWVDKNIKPELIKKQAQAKLEKKTEPVKAGTRADDFTNFLVSSGVGNKNLQSLTSKEQEELFKKFLEWKKRTGNLQ